jgi:hypothetical protein
MGTQLENEENSAEHFYQNFDITKCFIKHFQKSDIRGAHEWKF